MLCLLDPSHRLPSRHSLRGTVQELPHTPCRGNLRDRAVTELALRTGSVSR